mmetsp:Transcript_22829/g.30441  ORF Transcript_22829/g.30441 Transcript_22829/m.30441 type:complete len:80 (-) Transcript_22829:57-296(-)|eukprot:CAMPEP_0185569284 /NCGR_PEP_ID=MMETSP0434-20130131/1955_1 /TAXON_ID=626734 ORGANISM="Favella taraikaensis, Strain Fe Narragansett Bay" /NCGR_SAMPLE_ID=MMETSP0434 /ASSEMBLY_ACC=CAM_ASM_000379 /LENGTH=79 /DNA_ID=CAMNT_0028184023 /DNA_START=1876 /DNA_END=2115 /DNA_ORIENTATION=-
MMDYSMPLMNGGEATRTIRELLFNAAPDLPQPFICCMTSYVERNYKVEAYRAGMNGFLTKPIFKTGLRNLLLKAQIIKR